jgi:hypothetical protein
MAGRKYSQHSSEAIAAFSGLAGFYAKVNRNGFGHDIFIRVPGPAIEVLRAVILPYAYSMAVEAWETEIQNDTDNAGYTTSSALFVEEREKLFLKDQPAWMPKMVFPQGLKRAGGAKETYGSEFGKPVDKQTLKVPFPTSDWKGLQRGKVLPSEPKKQVVGSYSSANAGHNQEPYAGLACGDFC